MVPVVAWVATILVAVVVSWVAIASPLVVTADTLAAAVAWVVTAGTTTLAVVGT